MGIYANGGNMAGQLGNCDDTMLDSPDYLPIVALDREDIVAIAAGGLHAAALTKDGKVYTWGNSEYGVLGREGTESRPECVECTARFVEISAGAHHTAAVCSQGNVWAWGTFKNIEGNPVFSEHRKTARVPTVIARATSRMKYNRLISGHNYLVFRNTAGHILGYGNTQYGALGQYFSKRTIPNPPAIRKVFNTRLKILKNVSKVAAGAFHTVCLTESGTVYGLGLNTYGQLGCKDVGQSTNIPVKMASGIRDIACSDNNTIVVSSGGNVYVTGTNLYNQLGSRVRVKFSHDFVRVNGVSGVTKIWSGYSHIVCQTDENQLFGWGSNEFYQLGDADPIVSSPVRLAIFSGDNGDEQIENIATSSTNVFVLTKSKSL